MNDSRQVLEILGSDVTKAESIPFSVGDVTAGSETELQGAVEGSASTADLPLSLRSSNYFRNVVYRAAVGDTSRRSISRLERYLDENRDGIWENSWVRIPVANLGVFAGFVLDQDLRANKSEPESAYRSDLVRFRMIQGGREFFRLPICRQACACRRPGWPAGIVYTLAMARFLGDPHVRPDLSAGLVALWNPALIVVYQLIWWVLFIYHGRSQVTSSEISIRLEEGCIASPARRPV